MTGLPPRFLPPSRQPAALVVFLLMQSLAAVFFLGDAASELVSRPLGPHTLFEGIIAVALLLGVLFGAVALRVTLERLRSQETALAVAAGSLAEVIGAQFAGWRLTPAERDVGMLALKGLDVAEIAAARNTAAGTVRAQLTRIYAKAGVSGRAQFAAWFVEDLLGSAIGPGNAQPGVGKAG